MIHKEIAGLVEEFCSISDWVAVDEIKLNRRYKLKAVQAYAPTSSYGDGAVYSFYEDVESAMNRINTQYTTVMGHLSAQVGKKHVEREMGNFSIGSRNS